MASLKGAAEGDLIGVFKVAADRESAGEARHLDTQWCQEAGEVHGGGFAFDIWVRADDDLADLFSIEASEKFFHAELVRPHTFQRIDASLEDVVDAFEVAGLFDGHHIAGFFHNAHDGSLALDVRTDLAQVE